VSGEKVLPQPAVVADHAQANGQKSGKDGPPNPFFVPGGKDLG
jgi:hypothetical protein